MVLESNLESLIIEGFNLCFIHKMSSLSKKFKFFLFLEKSKVKHTPVFSNLKKSSFPTIFFIEKRTMSGSWVHYQMLQLI